MFLNVQISFTEDIINASVMIYNFVHEREYGNSDPILLVDDPYIKPLGVETCHTNYASNIFYNDASYFYSSVRETPRQYCKIRALNHNLHPVYDVISIMVKKNSPRYCLH